MNGVRTGSRTVAAAASEVDCSSTSIFLVSGGLRSSNSGEARDNVEGKVALDDQWQEGRRMV